VNRVELMRWFKMAQDTTVFKLHIQMCRRQHLVKFIMALDIFLYN